MADDKPAADDPARPQPSRRAKRQPPTIDGTAKDITSETDAAAAAARAAEEAVKASQQPAPAAESATQADPASATFQPESARDFIARDAEQSTPRDEAADAASRGRARAIWSDTFSATGLAAGLAGGLVVSLVLFALWLTGMVPIRYAGTTAMRARVSVLEMKVNDLGNRPVVRNDAFEALARRVAELDKTFAALKATPANDPAKDPAKDQVLAQRLDAAENAMKSVGVALAALSTRVDSTAARADSAEKTAAAAAKDANAIDRQTIARDSAADAQLAARIAVLEKSVSDLAAARNAETVDRGARRALAVLTLREAVLFGEAYDVELKAASALGVDKAALGKLEPLAASGVPGASALARDLIALLPALRAVQTSDTPQASGGTGFLDRLEANAAKLVRVRPVGSAAGSDPQAVITRVEQHAARGDIAAAVSELKSLPPRSRAPADGWIARAEARAAALQASRTLLADTSRAFGSR
ncbi:MAG: hypothetical protein J0H78_08860 [Rhizobiales bacterium]|nr:hypothetical protein [Hyphomicrobiales bacterium]OJY45622.1 MAG: hypothetical protein BGP08_17995 [Rhizobiales bacterium 64-17]